MAVILIRFNEEEEEIIRKYINKKVRNKNFLDFFI